MADGLGLEASSSAPQPPIVPFAWPGSGKYNQWMHWEKSQIKRESFFTLNKRYSNEASKLRYYFYKNFTRMKKIFTNLLKLFNRYFNS